MTRYSVLRGPVIEGNKSLAEMTDDVARTLDERPKRLWWLALAASASLLALGAAAVS